MILGVCMTQGRVYTVLVSRLLPVTTLRGKRTASSAVPFRCRLSHCISSCPTHFATSRDCRRGRRVCVVKLAFRDADTDTDTDT